MKKVLFLASILVLVAGCSRDKRTYVAEVNDHKVTADEFKGRYGLFLGNGGVRDNIIQRQKILNNMINEKLILDDITRQGFDNDAAYRERMEEITNQALVDGYAKRISVDTMAVGEQELLREFRLSNSKVSARYLYAKTETEAWKLKERLSRGETFESIAKDVFDDPGLANNGGSLGYFGWGEMEPALEDAAFSIPVGTISDPVRLNIGYAILRVDDRVQAPLAFESDYANKKDKLTASIVEKKTVRLVKAAAAEIGKSLAPSFNNDAVRLVLENWKYVQDPNLAASSLERQAFPDDISSMSFVNFRNRSWTIGDFLVMVRKTTVKQRKRVTTVDDVKDMAIGLATREVLLERSIASGLQNDSLVQKQIKRVSEEYMLKRWAQSVQDTVGRHDWPDELLQKQYVDHKSDYMVSPEVNVAEILVRTEAEASAMLQRVKKGADFGELARKNSIRLWAAKRGGELGFGTKSKYGVLGEKFFQAKTGEVLGPEGVPPYYGIFKILEKKEGRSMTMEEAHGQIIQQLVLLRKQEVIKDAVERLRTNASISINNENLANVVLH